MGILASRCHDGSEKEMSMDGIEITLILIGLGVILAGMIIRDLLMFSKEYDRLFKEGKDDLK